MVELLSLTEHVGVCLCVYSLVIVHFGGHGVSMAMSVRREEAFLALTPESIPLYKIYMKSMHTNPTVDRM